MSRGRAWGLFAFKALVSAVLVAYLVRRVGVDAFVTAVRMPGPLPLAAACLLLTAYFVLSGIRWLIVLRTLGHPLCWRRALRITLVVQFFSQLLPASVGGDLLRMWQSSRSGVAPAVAVNSVLLERITFVAGLAVFAVVMFVWKMGTHFPAGYLQALAAFALVAVGGAALLAILDKLPVARLPFGMADVVRGLAADAREVYRAPRNLMRGLVVLVAGQGAFAAALGVLGSEFGLELGLADYLAAGPLVVLAGALPISLAGWGVREIALVGILGGIGADPTGALQLSLAVGVLSLVAAVPGALVWAADWRNPDPGRRG